MDIRKVGVIGAGVMGSGIAAHLANAGFEVVLLDIVPRKKVIEQTITLQDGTQATVSRTEEPADRSIIAKSAIEKMLKTDPASFMSPKYAARITPGNQEDDFKRLAECDWIIEAIIENPKIKSDLFKRIDAVRKPGSIVSSNTSTIPLEVLTKDQTPAFAQDFLITHFFNPPRYMRLLELVGGKDTRKDALEDIARVCDSRLGKGVVVCNDRPGFIANRIGTFWMQKAINAAFDRGLTVEEADQMMSKPIGVPKTGVFGLIDLVGLDLMPHIAKSLIGSLPATDGYTTIHREYPLIQKMIQDGYTGRKGKGGFYRINRDNGGKIKESINLATGAYGASQDAQLDSAALKDLRAVVTHPDKGGQYCREVLFETLAYAAALVPEVADTLTAVDDAMKLGYGWRYGPFELIDKLGTGWFANQLKAEGKDVPPILLKAAGRPFYQTVGGQLQQLSTKAGEDYCPVERPAGTVLLGDIKRAANNKPLIKNGSAALWDIGDGVVCFEFKSKMNSLDPDILKLIRESIALVENSKGKYKAMVIHSDGENFSVGANLGLARFALNLGLFGEIEKLVEDGQNTYQAIKQAKFPIIGAPSGRALGGGCEILLHCHAVQAHAETYMGLVEVGVGLIPGWGGCKEMLLRAMENRKGPQGAMAKVAGVFETISTAKVSRSAAEAKSLGYLRETDGITMNRDRLLADAKARALALAPGFAPPKPVTLRLPGDSARTALEMAVQGMHAQGKATDYDVIVSKALAEVLSGGPNADITREVTEQEMLALERKAFLDLVRQTGTWDRIGTMLDTGKPLREEITVGTPKAPVDPAASARDAANNARLAAVKSSVLTAMDSLQTRSAPFVPQHMLPPGLDAQMTAWFEASFRAGAHTMFKSVLNAADSIPVQGVSEISAQQNIVMSTNRIFERLSDRAPYGEDSPRRQAWDAGLAAARNTVLRAAGFAVPGLETGADQGVHPTTSPAPQPSRPGSTPKRVFTIYDLVI